jgi:hypothetical protein
MKQRKAPQVVHEMIEDRMKWWRETNARTPAEVRAPDNLIPLSVHPYYQTPAPLFYRLARRPKKF